jgi:coenzyme F420 biosynthesis associated uncharacterized protein
MRSILTNKRLIAFGLLFGAAVGAWAGARSREFTDRGEKPTLIDWEQARAFAMRMNAQSSYSDAERAMLSAEYQRLIDEAVPYISAYTGDTLPSALDRVYAFDRTEWVDANIRNFKELFAPLERLNPLNDQDDVGAFSVAWGAVNQRILSTELGFLLGYLARRVLGQYDITLLGREPMEGGRLYFVHPNIVGIERAMRLPSRDFRLWLALHEATHAFEFETNPWLRDHFNSLLTRYISHLHEDVEHLKRGLDGLRLIWSRARSGESVTGNWLEYVMTPEQRELFSEMQAMMSVVEGYSNHVMNVVGKDLIPTYDVIARRFERRLQQRTLAEVLFARLTGLDIKLEQYRKGEAFINHVAGVGGHDLVTRVWDGPESLPTLHEITHPDEWIARVQRES